MNNVTFFNSYVTNKELWRLSLNYTLKSSIMPLLTILIVLIVAGVVLWLINTYIPMDRTIKTILNVVVVIVVIVWLLKAFGLFHYLNDIHI